MNITYEVIPIKVSCTNYINYSYLIVDLESRQAAVVDPAWEIETITGALDEHNARLTTILLTHSHFDHVNLAEPLVSQFHSKVYMSKEEIDFYHFTCSHLSGISESDTIRLGKTLICCLITPGHTVGSVCYLLSDCLFTGDTIFTEGCGICSTVGGDPAQMFRSLQRIKTTISPDIRIYPGHSFGEVPGHYLDELLNNNIYFQFNDEERFIKFRMRKNQTNNYNFQ